MKKALSQRNEKAVAFSRKEAIRYLVQEAKNADVKFIRIWFSDILGMLKSFAITIDGLESALEEGIGIDGSSIESFARSEEHDMVAVPDISTFRVLPWRPRENAVARLIADIRSFDGRPFAGDPRNCLKRQLKIAAGMGFTYYVAPEMEYFYFKGPDRTEPLDPGGYFDLTPLDAGTDLRRQTVLMLEEMGIPVHSSHHEVAPSQHEIDLRYMDALTMADAAITYRLIVKEVAMRNGVYATFMPKPVEGQNGSGMHVHQSLFYSARSAKGQERNAFFDPKDRYHLSRIGKSYVAGILKHAREMALVTNQWVNSYKRLVTGHEAPTHIFWGQHNRSALVRIPLYKSGREASVRAEFRSPDAACNPYLAFTVMLAAGLKGIREGYRLPAPVEEDVVRWTPEEKLSRGIEELPTSLGEAIRIAEKSSFLKESLGEHLFRSLIENKKIEWENYRRHVSPFEIKKDLATL